MGKVPRREEEVTAAELYSVSEFSALAGVSQKTTYRKIARGLIPAVRLAGQVRIPAWFLSDLTRRPGEMPRLAISNTNGKSVS